MLHTLFICAIGVEGEVDLVFLMVEECVRVLFFLAFFRVAKDARALVVNGRTHLTSILAVVEVVGGLLPLVIDERGKN